jgi:hypothetical protein
MKATDFRPATMPGKKLAAPVCRDFISPEVGVLEVSSGDISVVVAVAERGTDYRGRRDCPAPNRIVHVVSLGKAGEFASKRSIARAAPKKAPIRQFRDRRDHRRIGAARV